MIFRFESKIIPSRSIQINGKIKKAIEEYRKKKVPMSVLLTNFLAVKSKGDVLAEAENPWAYFYKGIEVHEVESGILYAFPVGNSLNSCKYKHFGKRDI